MKVFVWNKNFMRDYSSGCGIVYAHDVEEARRVMRKELDRRGYLEAHGADLEAEPDDQFELNGPTVIAIEYGGG